jgi:L-ectoine synthase
MDRPKGGTDRMIVRSLAQIMNTDRNVETEKWASRRLLVKGDGLGFSLSETIIHPGSESTIWYKNHFEACYCVEGEGEIEALEPEHRICRIAPGTLYALDQHDKHLLRAFTTMKLICVFKPALSGTEVHDADGSYPP